MTNTGAGPELSTVRSATAEVIFDRYLGALLGAAIADALGWITEFRKSEHELDKMGIERVEHFLTWSKPTGGRFHTYIDYVSKGEYSDDTQLLLCTARSLNQNGGFDPDRFADELKAWLDYARGAGAAIMAGARNLRTVHKATWHSNFYKTRGRQGRRGYVDAGGNGAAMRIAPHALANRHDAVATADGVWENAVTTHGHPRAIVGALTIAEAVRLLAEAQFITKAEIVAHLLDFVGRIRVPAREEFLAWLSTWESNAGRPFPPALEETKSEMQSMLRVAANPDLQLRQTLSTLGCFRPATKGSGTACVAAAIGAFLREPSNYRQGVLSLVNTIGIDTDTIASMYGTLVGLRVGSTNIPDVWSANMQDYEYFISVSHALTNIALRVAKQNDLRVDMSLVRKREGTDIVELTRERTVTKNQRVIHYLLGPGWVRAVSEQQVRSGGMMLLADAVLDCGQSVRFRSSRPARGPRRGKKAPRPPASGEQLSFRVHKS